MNRTIPIIFSLFTLIACLFLSACAVHTSHITPFPNPFFAMDTGTKDANHPTILRQAPMLSELGYDGFGYTGTKAIPETLNELDKYHLRLFTIYLQVSIDPGKPNYDPALPQAVKQLKGRQTILWLTVNSKSCKPSSPDGDPCAVKIISEIADIAQQSGLRVALYPHFGSWLERVEHAVRLAKKVNRKNLGVTFNLCHWLRTDDEKNLQPILRAAMPYLFLVTINGADSGGKDWNQLIQPLDSGTFDTFRFLRTLKQLGYTGPIGLQHYGIKGDARKNLKRSISAWILFDCKT